LFKVWANNKLGAGAGAIVETVTKNDPQEIGKKLKSRLLGLSPE